MKESEDINTISRNFQVNSNEDVAQADKYLELLKESRKSIIETLRTRTLEMESYFAKDIMDNCGILNWENRKVRFCIDRERVILDFVYNVEKNKYVSTEIKVATSKYFFIDCSSSKKPNIEKAGIELCDAYSIRYPNAEINLFELDNDSETEFVDMLCYVSKEFRQRKQHGSLFGQLKGFYLELVSYWEEIDKVDNSISILNYGRVAFLKNECIAKVKSMDVFKTGNVIIIFTKDKEETEFYAFEIDNIGRKYYHIINHSGVIDYSTLHISRIETQEDYEKITDDHYVYYLKIKKGNKVLEYGMEDLKHIIGESFFIQGNIEVYTADEWKDFLMLNKNENDHLLNTTKISSEVLEISKNYGRIRSIKSKV